MTDIDGSRVLEVTQGRDEEAANALWKTFENSAAKNIPDAGIVRDQFHISKHLNEAVDKVRRQEHQSLLKEGDETLKGSKFMWLRNPENISDEKLDSFEVLKAAELKTSRAWAIREQFRWFWEAKSNRRPMREEQGMGCGSRTQQATRRSFSTSGISVVLCGRPALDWNQSRRPRR